MKLTLKLFASFVVVSALCIASLPYAVGTEYFAGHCSEYLSQLLGRSTSFSNAKLRLGKLIGLSLRDVRIGNPGWASERNLLTADRLSAEIPLQKLLRGDFKFSSIAAENVNAFLEESEQGTGSWEDWGTGGKQRDSDSGTTSQTDIVETDKLTIQNATLHINHDINSYLPLRINVLNLTNVGTPRSGKHSGKILLKDKELVLDFSHSPLHSLISGENTPFDINAFWDSHEAKIHAKLLLEHGKDIQVDAIVELHGPNLSELSPIVSAQLPSAEAYDISASVSWAHGSVDISNLRAKLGESDLAGSVAIGIKNQPLKIDAKVTSERIRVADFAGPSAEKSDSSQISDQAKRAKIPYEALSLLQGDLQLTAKQFEPRDDLVLSDVDISAAINGGELKIAKLILKGLEGSFDGKGSFSKEGITLAAAGHGISFPELRRMLGIRGVINGTGDIEVDLSAKGDNSEELLQSVSGKLFAATPGGTLEDSNLKLLSSGLHDIFEPILGESKAVPIKCSVLKVDVDHGNFKVNEYVARLGNLDVFANGSLDAVKRRFAFDFYSRATMPSLSALLPPFKVFGELGGKLTALPNPVGVAADVLDTAEGVTRGTVSKIGHGVGSAVDLVLNKEHTRSELSGVPLCLDIIESDKSTISSRVGSVLE
ncbi:MAG: AsmA family protein [Bdellovibrionales bacterium]|nr:AsmA family protein [Bdellovibrionales bacterium]